MAPWNVVFPEFQGVCISPLPFDHISSEGEHSREGVICKLCSSSPFDCGVVISQTQESGVSRRKPFNLKFPLGFSILLTICSKCVTLILSRNLEPHKCFVDGCMNLLSHCLCVKSENMQISM